MPSKKCKQQLMLVATARKKHPEKMTQKQIDKIIEQITKFLELHGDETTSMQINIYRGGLTGISVFLPKKEIKHYNPTGLLDR